ncbi:MAG: hypothetical protein AVDCRST_MAG02-2703, partial [uncultured Rubrobacteraceae bacterium]
GRGRHGRGGRRLLRRLPRDGRPLRRRRQRDHHRPRDGRDPHERRAHRRAGDRRGPLRAPRRAGGAGHRRRRAREGCPRGPAEQRGVRGHQARHGPLDRTVFVPPEEPGGHPGRGRPDAEQPRRVLAAQGRRTDRARGRVHLHQRGLLEALVPGTERKGPRTVSPTADDIVDAWEGFFAAPLLGLRRGLRV